MLEDVTQSEISQTQKDKQHFHLQETHQDVKFIQKVEWQLPGAGAAGGWELLFMDFASFSFTR